MVIKMELTEEVNRIRKVMGLNEGVKHIYQPTGNSCGPTCLKMVGEFIMGNVSEIDDICKTCGTDCKSPILESLSHNDRSSAGKSISL